MYPLVDIPKKELAVEELELDEDELFPSAIKIGEEPEVAESAPIAVHPAIQLSVAAEPAKAPR